MLHTRTVAALGFVTSLVECDVPVSRHVLDDKALCNLTGVFYSAQLHNLARKLAAKSQENLSTSVN